MTIHHRHAFLAVCGILASRSSPQARRRATRTSALSSAHSASSMRRAVASRSRWPCRSAPGQGDSNTPGSSTYLIRRDPARAIRRGRQLFQRKFSIVRRFGAARHRGLDGRHHQDAQARRRAVGQLRRVPWPAARLRRRRRRRRDVSRQPRRAALVRLGSHRDAGRRDDDGLARDSRASAARGARRHDATARRSGADAARRPPAPARPTTVSRR